MNIGKSIKVALAKNEMKQTELAKKIGVTHTYMSAVSNRDTCTGDMLAKLSEAFNMSASEFIALGE